MNCNANEWNPDDKLITPKEFQRLTGRGHTSTYDKLKKGKIPCRKWEDRYLINWTLFCRMLQR